MKSLVRSDQIVATVTTVFALVFAAGCTAGVDVGPSPLCRSDVVVAIAPGPPLDVSWLLPAGVVEDAIEIRLTPPGRVVRVVPPVRSLTIDAGAVTAVAVRARVCGHWGSWVTVAIGGVR